MCLRKLLLPFIYIFILSLLFTIRIEKRTQYPKVWAHRVNNLDEIAIKQQKFMGLEVDLIFSNANNTLYVGHYLVDSSNRVLFTDWLSCFTEKKRKNSYYWLDMKNINYDNSEKISILLNEITEKYKIKDRVWVESYDWKALETVKKHGFQVLLWIENLHWRSDLDTLQWFQMTQETINLLEPDGISCMFVMYPLLTDMFPDENIFFWHTPADYTPENVALTQQLCREKSVKAVLVDYSNIVDY